MFAVNNIFENGEFKQKLDMFSLPVVDDTSNLTNDNTLIDSRRTNEAKRQQVTVNQIAQTPGDANIILASAKSPVPTSNSGNVDNTTMTSQQKIDLRKSKRV